MTDRSQDERLRAPAIAARSSHLRPAIAAEAALDLDRLVVAPPITDHAPSGIASPFERAPFLCVHDVDGMAGIGPRAGAPLPPRAGHHAHRRCCVACNKAVRARNRRTAVRR